MHAYHYFGDIAWALCLQETNMHAYHFGDIAWALTFFARNKYACMSLFLEIQWMHFSVTCSKWFGKLKVVVITLNFCKEWAGMSWWQIATNKADCVRATGVRWKAGTTTWFFLSCSWCWFITGENRILASFMSLIYDGILKNLPSWVNEQYLKECPVWFRAMPPPKIWLRRPRLRFL